MHGLFDLPADKAVRQLGLRRTVEATTAADALTGTDPEALHAFRVAVRRTRTLLRAYHQVVRVPAKWRGRLRTIARATGTARDLEVALERLHALAESTHPALRRLERRLGADHEHAQAEASAHVTKAWPKLAKHLRAIFLEEHTPVSGENFGAVTTRLIEAQWFELQQHLEELRAEWRDDTAHRARLAGKRLRYLLEPLAAERPVGAAVNALKAFQDRLGDYHDASVLLGLVAESAAAEAASATHAQVLAGTTGRGGSLAACLARAEHLRQGRSELGSVLRDTYVADDPMALSPVVDAITALRQRATA